MLRLIEGLVRAPQLLAWCDDLDVMGRPFLVQEWIDGHSVTDALPSADWEPVSAANALGEDMMLQLAAVHDVT